MATASPEQRHQQRHPARSQGVLALIGAMNRLKVFSRMPVGPSMIATTDASSTPPLVAENFCRHAWPSEVGRAQVVEGAVEADLRGIGVVAQHVAIGGVLRGQLVRTDVEQVVGAGGQRQVGAEPVARRCR